MRGFVLHSSVRLTVDKSLLVSVSLISASLACLITSNQLVSFLSLLFLLFASPRLYQITSFSPCGRKIANFSLLTGACEVLRSLMRGNQITKLQSIARRHLCIETRNTAGRETLRGQRVSVVQATNRRVCCSIWTGAIFYVSFLVTYILRVSLRPISPGHALYRK